MNSYSHQHLRPIHHSFLSPSLSNSEKKYEFNKKIAHSEYFCHIQPKLLKEQESKLSVFSRRLQIGLKQIHNENKHHLKQHKNQFLKEEEIKIKQTKNILIIQQKSSKQAGFSLNMIASKSEQRMKDKSATKRPSLLQKSAEKIPFISYPVERIKDFRNKVTNFLQNQDAKNVQTFQRVYKLKRLKRRSKLQLLENKQKIKIAGFPGDLGRLCFVVSSSLEETQKKIGKKVKSIYESSYQSKRGSFRRLSKRQEKKQKMKTQLDIIRQTGQIVLERQKEAQISPWNSHIVSKYL